MRNVRVTYGTPAFIEYEAQIKVGKKSLKICFTGGIHTSYGVTPATFATSNPIVQHAIEHSEHFKSGRIVKLGEIELAGENRIKMESNPVREIAEAEEPAEADDSSAETIESEESENTEERTAEAVEASTEAEREIVQVTCLDDAAEFLKERYGVSKRNIRSMEAANSAAMTNGVKFEWV
jgi:hypothetical protein